MPLRMRFPRSAFAQRTKVENDFIYYAGLIRDHLSGRTLPQGMPIDKQHASAWNRHFMTRLRTPIEGEPVATECVIQQAWMASTAIYDELRGKTVDDMYEVLNRQHALIVDHLVGSFFETDEDYLAFNLKSATPPKLIQSREFDRPSVRWQSSCHADVPAHISMDGSILAMRWEEGNGQLHRDIDKGPALVEVWLTDGLVRVQHFTGGARTRGHDKWAKKCAGSNPWLKYTTTEE